MSAQVTVKGRLTADPELTFTSGGKAVAKFSVVSARRVKDNQTGEWSDADTSFWNAVAFGDFAENICESLEKGTSVIVTGTMKQEIYEKEGQKVYAWKLMADDVAASCKWAKVQATRNPPRSDTGDRRSWGTSRKDTEEDRRPWGTSRSDAASAFNEELPF